jgi:endonuclease I
MSRRSLIWCLALALGSCAQVDDLDDLDVEDSFLEAGRDEFSWRMEILGTIRYGETRGPVRYVFSAENRYRAYEFRGVAGDPVDIWVKSDEDAVGWLLDENFEILLKSKNVSATNKDAHLMGTLPRDGVFYVAFREYKLKSADFTVSIDGPASDPYGDLHDAELFARLHDDTQSLHTRPQGYDQAKRHLYAVDGLETLPSGEIESQYTGSRVTPTGENDPGNFNTEHTWPQSRGASASPARGDLHHLFATTETSNSRRGNLEFGETPCGDSGQAACTWTDGGSQLGFDTAGRQIFEVRAPRRGDSARAIFYMSVRYNWRISAAEETVLRRWNAEDPPSDWERRRDLMVETVQGNQNPFIWRPDLVERISDF